MQFEILYGEQRIPVELKTSSGQDEIFIDGRRISCDWIRLGDGHYSVVLNGRVYDVVVQISGDNCVVSDHTGNMQLHIVDLRSLAAYRRVEKAQVGLQRVRAEMPGKVVRVLCKVGDTVAYDQGLVVIEAMKMQNEIRAPKSGVVKEIAVQEGKALSSGDFILSLE